MKKAGHELKSKEKAAKPKKKKNVCPNSSTYNQAAQKVGWKDPGGFKKYPTSQQVTKAIKSHDIEQMIKWIRFLPNPEEDKEFDLWNRIADKLNILKKEVQ